MAKNRTRTALAPTLISLAVASCFATSTALANPTGANVVRGTAAIHQAGNLLQITNSPNAIINWQSFSIGANEITRFLQQSSSSAVLNRVITQNPSQILGSLQSNGRVFLINPNGILFGAGAQIDVGGLVASTLRMSDDDFLAGRLRFGDGLGKSVVNDGSIATGPGGSVYLIGSGVTNNGIIRSPQGEVVLAAGNSVELVSPGTPNLRVEIAATDNEARNLGQIISEAGRIGIYAGLINNSGQIRADSVVSEGGRILLKASKSTTLESTSVLNAQGQGGGRIEVLAGEEVSVAGRLDASAPNGGDGGFVETSGKNFSIDPSVVITTAAPFGTTGTWLIDPADFVIGALGNITGAALAILLGTNNVVISSDGVFLPDPIPSLTLGNGDIFVNDRVAWASANSLTLTAKRDVNVNNVITNSGTGGINLNAGWDGAGAPDSPNLTGAGKISIIANVSSHGSLQLNAGDSINITGATVAAGDIASSGSPGFIGMNALSGAVAINNSIIRAVGSNRDGSSAAVNVRAGAGISVVNSALAATGGNGATSGGGAQVELRADSGGISVNGGTINASGGAGGTATGGGFANASGGFAGVFLNADTNINVNAGSSISAAGGAGGTATASTGDAFADGGFAFVDLRAPSGVIVDGVIVATGGGAGTAAGIAASTNGGFAGVFLDTGGPIAVGGNVTATGGAGAGTGGLGGSASVSMFFDCNGDGCFAPSASLTVGGSVTAMGGTGVFGGGDGVVSAHVSGDTNISGTISAAGGNGSGAFASGGGAFISSSSGGTISAAGTVTATGGNGAEGGSARVELFFDNCNDGCFGPVGSIAVNGGAITAAGGTGTSFGGDASIEMNATGNISIASAVNARGGNGSSRGEALVEVVSNAGSITVINGSIEAGSNQLPAANAEIALQSGGGGVSLTNPRIAAYAGSGEADVDLETSGSFTTTGGTIEALTGGCVSCTASVSIESAGNVSLGTTNITAFGDSGGTIEIDASSGFIRSSGGVLSASDFLQGNGSHIRFTARDGIGLIGSPVRIQEVVQTPVFADNLASGDIVLSAVTGDSIINGTRNGIFNASPNGTYDFTSETGNFILSSPFRPASQFLCGGPCSPVPPSPGQSVVFRAPNGDVTLTSGQFVPDIVTSGGGSLTLIGRNVTQNAGNVSGVLNATATAGNVTMSQGGSYTVGQISATGAVTLNSNGGAIVDGNGATNNITAPVASVVGVNGIGSLADPLETQVAQVSLFGGIGEVGVMNTGNLSLINLSTNNAAAVGAIGTLSLTNPQGVMTVGGNLRLHANGIHVSRGMSVGGELRLEAQAGDLVIAADGGQAVGLGANSIFLQGANVTLGDPSQTFDVDINASNGVAINATAGNLTVQGGNGGHTFVLALNNNVNIMTTGDVNVNGGSNGGFAHVLGNPDVVMSVGGTVQFNATDPSAPARIEAGTLSTVFVDFVNQTSGGYFINGMESVVADPALGTGFYALNQPAVLGQNLTISYGGMPQVNPLLPPPFEEGPIERLPPNQLVVSMNQQADVLADQLKAGDPGLTVDKEKKKLPFCSN